jgi:carbon storage regulator
MLVLTRRIGEEIVIAGDIRVTVLAVTGKAVRLGITAPSSVRVLREELLATTDVPQHQDRQNLCDYSNTRDDG